MKKKTFQVQDETELVPIHTKKKYLKSSRDSQLDITWQCHLATFKGQH